MPSWISETVFLFCSIGVEWNGGGGEAIDNESSRIYIHFFRENASTKKPPINLFAIINFNWPIYIVYCGPITIRIT